MKKLTFLLTALAFSPAAQAKQSVNCATGAQLAQNIITAIQHSGLIENDCAELDKITQKLDSNPNGYSNPNTCDAAQNKLMQRGFNICSKLNGKKQ